MGDLREELVLTGGDAIHRLEETADQPFLSDEEHAQAVIDSITPGAYVVRENRTWVRLKLQPCDIHGSDHLTGSCSLSRPLYTEVTDA